jgi:hypothetical protein
LMISDSFWHTKTEQQTKPSPSPKPKQQCWRRINPSAFGTSPRNNPSASFLGTSPRGEGCHYVPFLWVLIPWVRIPLLIPWVRNDCPSRVGAAKQVLLGWGVGVGYVTRL